MPYIGPVYWPYKILISRFPQFSEVYQPTKKGIYRVALYDFLSDAATSAGYTAVHAPDTVNIDEVALGKLLEWAVGGFEPCGPPQVWAPSGSYISCSSRSRLKSGGDLREVDRGEGCVGCQNPASHDHPLFNDLSFCNRCFNDFSQCAFLFGDDGTGFVCVAIRGTVNTRFTGPLGRNELGKVNREAR